MVARLALPGRGSSPRGPCCLPAPAAGPSRPRPLTPGLTEPPPGGVGCAPRDPPAPLPTPLVLHPDDPSDSVVTLVGGRQLGSLSPKTGRTPSDCPPSSPRAPDHVMSGLGFGAPLSSLARSRGSSGIMKVPPGPQAASSCGLWGALSQLWPPVTLSACRCLWLCGRGRCPGLFLPQAGSQGAPGSGLGGRGGFSPPGGLSAPLTDPS